MLHIEVSIRVGIRVSIRVSIKVGIRVGIGVGIKVSIRVGIGVSIKVSIRVGIVSTKINQINMRKSKLFRKDVYHFKMFVPAM